MRTRLPISHHKCLIYEGHPSEQLPVIVPLLIDNLRENRRCLYLGDPEMVHMVDSALAAKGVDVSREMRRGALLFSSDRGHLDGGGFDPAAMIAMLCRLIDEAVREGFQGLCATGDMKWELGPEKNFDRLLEYEARLEKVFREKPLSGVCQYHRDTVPARAIRDALITHQSAYIGHALNRDNLFYVPPELLLENPSLEIRDKQADWMWQQITRILRAEQERDQALKVLQETNQNLERRVHERTMDLENMNKELETFSYSVSHDLRAPLRSIDGFTRIVMEEKGTSLGAKARMNLERVCTAAGRMGVLIDDLLKLSQVSRHTLGLKEVNLSVRVQEIAQELRGAYAHPVELDIAPEVKAIADYGLLSIALQNLLSNAWKFTAKTPHARITFGVQEGVKSRTFYLRDNGAGFDMRYADKLFGAFQRLHTEKEFPGTGIGLAIVQRTIHRHGGTLRAEARVGQGATFYFTLERAT